MGRSHRLQWDDPRLDEFWRPRRHASLTTLRHGLPHTVPVAPVPDRGAGVLLVLTDGGSQKVRNLHDAPDPVVTLCEIDGRHWVTVEGRARIDRDPAVVAHAEELYAHRFRTPRVNPDRVILVVEPTRILGTL